MTELQPLDGSVLPAGIRARFVERVNGLRVHILKAGEPGRPCLLLLHGFPELAYSWRKIMAPLAAAGYHVVAHRGQMAERVQIVVIIGARLS